MSLIIVKGKKRIRMNREELLKSVIPFERVVLDIGTGDGKFILKSARVSPTVFFIGIDPVAGNLEETSTKTYKKSSRGGVANALYVVSSLEDLPDELDAIATEIRVNMPWGNLLEGLIDGDELILHSITRVAKPKATLEILINYAVFYGDRAPLEMSHLPPLTYEHIENNLVDRYKKAGISIVEWELIGKSDLMTIPATWVKKLAHGREPRTMRIRAIVNPDRSPD